MWCPSVQCASDFLPSLFPQIVLLKNVDWNQVTVSFSSMDWTWGLSLIDIIIISSSCSSILPIKLLSSIFWDIRPCFFSRRSHLLPLWKSPCIVPANPSQNTWSFHMFFYTLILISLCMSRILQLKSSTHIVSASCHFFEKMKVSTRKTTLHIMYLYKVYLHQQTWGVCLFVSNKTQKIVHRLKDELILVNAIQHLQLKTQGGWFVRQRYSSAQKPHKRCWYVSTEPRWRFLLFRG